MSKFQKSVLCEIHKLNEDISFNDLCIIVRKNIDFNIPVHSIKRSVISMIGKGFINIDTGSVWDNTKISITDKGIEYSGVNQIQIDFSYNENLALFEKKEAEKKEFISAHGFDPESGDVV